MKNNNLNNEKNNELSSKKIFFTILALIVILILGIFIGFFISNNTNPPIIENQENSKNKKYNNNEIIETNTFNTVENEIEDKTNNQENIILEKADYIKTWESELEGTEIHLYENGTFIKDNYNISSEIKGSYVVNNNLIEFTTENKEKWNGIFSTESDKITLTITIDGHDIIFYDLSKNNNNSTNSEKQTNNNTNTQSNTILEKSDYIKTWESELEGTEIHLYENGTFIKDNYNISSEIKGSYVVNNNLIEFTTENKEKWNGIFSTESDKLTLTVTIDGHDIIFYDL